MNSKQLPRVFSIFLGLKCRFLTIIFLFKLETINFAPEQVQRQWWWWWRWAINWPRIRVITPPSHPPGKVAERAHGEVWRVGPHGCHVQDYLLRSCPVFLGCTHQRWLCCCCRYVPQCVESEERSSVWPEFVFSSECYLYFLSCICVHLCHSCLKLSLWF